MSSKYDNMIQAYQGFTGPQTLRAIRQRLPAEIIQALTGKQLALVLTAINTACHDGRRSTGGEVYDSSVEDGAVWVDVLGRSITWRREGSTLVCAAR